MGMGKRKRLSMAPLPMRYARLAWLFPSPPHEGALRHNKRGGESGWGGVRLGQLGVDRALRHGRQIVMKCMELVQSLLANTRPDGD